jgi:hypothetical protein
VISILIDFGEVPMFGGRKGVSSLNNRSAFRGLHFESLEDRRLLATVLESIIVPVGGISVTSTTVLEPGVTYQLRASGTFSIGGPGDGLADTEYQNFLAPSGMCDAPDNTDVGIGVNDTVNDTSKFPFWGPYNPTHVYTIDYVGQGARIRLNYHDCWYFDNIGSLKVEILHEVDIGAKTLSIDGNFANYTYEITNGDLPSDSAVALYWSANDTFETSDALAYSQPITGNGRVVGTHSGSISSAALAAPAGTRFLVLVVDPNDTVAEELSNNIFPLQLTSEHMLTNAINAAQDVRIDPADPGRIIISYSPPFGLSLDDAAIICGVHHFNWEQIVRGPSHWQWYVGRDIAFDNNDNPLFQRDPISGKLMHTGGQLNGTEVDLDPAVGVNSQALGSKGFFDPILRPLGNESYVLFIDNNQVGDSFYEAINQFWADQFTPYLNEIPADWAQYSGVYGPGGTKSPMELEFRDRPNIPKTWFSGPNQFLTFVTELVGVHSNLATERFPYSGTRVKWRSNATTASVIGVFHPGLGIPQGIESGGIFSVEVLDRTKNGDADLDGDSDQDDYQIWKATFGSPEDLRADFTENGSVDAADYVIWRKNHIVTELAQTASAGLVVSTVGNSFNGRPKEGLAEIPTDIVETALFDLATSTRGIRSSEANRPKFIGRAVPWIKNDDLLLLAQGTVRSAAVSDIERHRHHEDQPPRHDAMTCEPPPLDDAKHNLSDFVGQNGAKEGTAFFHDG